MIFLRRTVIFSFFLAIVVDAFVPLLSSTGRNGLPLRVVSEETAEDAEVNVVWIEEEDEEEDEGDSAPSDIIKSSRWDALNPTIKARIVKNGQERAIANKKKRESPGDKKRRE
jgi:hypothetical protein